MGGGGYLGGNIEKMKIWNFDSQGLQITFKSSQILDKKSFSHRIKIDQIWIKSNNFEQIFLTK